MNIAKKKIIKRKKTSGWGLPFLNETIDLISEMVMQR